MDFWYPKLNSKGQVVGGSGEIWMMHHYTQTSGVKLGSGWHPSFYLDDTIVYYTNTDWRIQNINNADIITIKPEAVSLVLGGGGEILRQIIPNVFWGSNIFSGRVPSLSSNGANVIWTSPYFNEWTNIVWNTKVFTPLKQVFSTSAADSAIVWTEYAETQPHRVFGCKDGVTIEELTVTGWEDARVFDTPSGPVILSILQDGIFVRKWKEKLGWRYVGIFDEPSARYLDGKLIVVYSRQGQLGYLEINLAVPIDPVDPIPIPPDPIPPDPPEPEPPDPPDPEPPDPDNGDDMEPIDVALILIDGKFISFDAGQLKLDNPEVTENCKFTLSKPDNLWSLVHKTTGLWLGADATQHTPNVASQLYLIDHRAGYESWNVEHPAPPDNDLISAFVVFRRPEGINFSVKLRVVEL